MNNNCRRCGKETDGRELYCSECLDSSGAGKPKNFWPFAILFSVVLLILSGMLLWHGNFFIGDFSWGALIGRPAATINGEAISRSDLRDRVKVSVRMLEQQYGEDIFSGGVGKTRLVSLQKEVLERMLEERLIAQEASRLGIKISNESLDRELQRIAGEIYGSWENFQKRTGEDGITPAVLKNHIRHIMTLQALMEVKAAPAAAGTPPEDYFNAWLVQAKKAAKVNVYDAAATVSGVSSGRGGCCGSGGSSGCGGQQKTPGPVDAQTEKQASEAALAEYRKNNPAEKDVEARVNDYGCHIQVDIDKDGKTLKSYSYQDGKVTDN